MCLRFANEGQKCNVSVKRKMTTKESNRVYIRVFIAYEMPIRYANVNVQRVTLLSTKETEVTLMILGDSQSKSHIIANTGVKYPNKCW